MRITAAAAIAVAFLASPSYAQPAGAQAEVLFRQGRDLMSAGKIAEPCSAFEESQKLDPAVTTLLNLAACREKSGQLATAWGHFLEAERQTRGADPASQQLHAAAQQHAKSLEARVSKLTIKVPEASRIDHLEVKRDAESIPTVMWNRALPIDGGHYTISASAPGTEAWTTHVTIANESDDKTVEIPNLRTLNHDLGEPTPSPPAHAKPTDVPEAPAVAAAPTSAGPGSESDTGSGASKVVPLALGAGAVVLFGGALGFDLWGNSTYDDAKAETMDQMRRDSLYNSANAKRYVAEGMLVAGVGCTAAAVLLYLRGRHDASPADSDVGVHVTPLATGDRAGLAVVGRF